MSVALALLNPPQYHARTRDGGGVLRVASNTVSGAEGDHGELRYAIKGRDGRPWALPHLRSAVLDAFMYGDGFLDKLGVHVDYHDVYIRREARAR